MSGDSSEEKSLPPSEKKLRDEREKGKVAKAPDLMVAITTGALIGYVWVAAPSMSREMQEAIAIAGHCVELDFDHGARTMLAETQSLLIMFGLLPLLIAVVSVVIASILINRGFVFATEPLVPKPETLNPVAGLKNLYKMKSWVELVKSLVKAVLFGAALVEIARAAIGPLVEAPVCSPGCLPSMLRSILTPLLGVGCVFYMVSGVLDLLIQRWLFRHDMRMTKTEKKQENKSTNGNPQIKGQLRRLRRESAQAGRTGLSQATVIICTAGLSIGLRYVKGETGLPLVVCRAAGEASKKMVTDARTNRLPVFWDGPLATDLAKKIQVGQTITQPFFTRCAQAILASGRSR